MQHIKNKKIKPLFQLLHQLLSDAKEKSKKAFLSELAKLFTEAKMFYKNNIFLSAKQYFLPVCLLGELTQGCNAIFNLANVFYKEKDYENAHEFFSTIPIIVPDTSLALSAEEACQRLRDRLKESNSEEALRPK